MGTRNIQLHRVSVQAGGLTSLWDIMGRFVLQQFAYMIEQLVRIEGQASDRVSASDAKTLVPEDRLAGFLLPTLQFLQGQCKEIEFEKGVWQVEAIKQKAKRAELTYDFLRNELGRLQADIKWELGDRFFFYAPIERKKVFDEIQFSWKDICKAFPTAWADIQEASFCYTLERDTACLFHLMRIAEHGVRRLARTLKVTLTHKGRVHPIEYADWEKIITGIKVRIDAMRQLPHGKKRKEALQRYSDLADHCSYMKDIWRNDISHAGKPYIGPEALLAIRRVYGFMSLLTKKQ